VLGASGPVLLFVHGFGCDQSVWGRVAGSFAADHRVVLFDLVGSGHSETAAYSPDRYATLQGYADDLVEMCDGLAFTDVTLVAHSVGATIGVLAALKRPEVFARLALVCPSPRYANAGDYIGGFEPRDIADLLDLLDINHVEWAAALAPVLMGPGSDVGVQDDWREGVCRIDPAVAKQFAHVTFTSDHRTDFARLSAPTLIIECKEDALAPREVGAFCAGAVKGSQLVTLDGSGHCPHLTMPDSLSDVLRRYLDDPVALSRAA
jgi:sigma-B regulation protein RsbQ